MRLGQGLPVNMIVLTALALLVLVVVGSFFISGFGQASGSINIVERDQATCQSICQGITTAAFNYDSCDSLVNNPQVTSYQTDDDNGDNCYDIIGACTVTIRGGTQCQIVSDTVNTL